MNETKKIKELEDTILQLETEIQQYPALKDSHTDQIKSIRTYIQELKKTLS